MRIAVAYYANKNKGLIDIAKGIEKALTAKGHTAVLVDIQKSGLRLTGFNFIYIGYNTQSLFGGLITDDFISRIKGSGSLTGRHCSCFVDKKFGSFKTLTSLMRIIEREGAILFSSEEYISGEHAMSLTEKASIE